MLLPELIAPADAVLDARIADKAQVLKALAVRLSVRSGVPIASVEAALQAREELGSTGIGAGIALPHARVAGGCATCAVLVRLARPIDFAAVDGKPVDLFCAILASADRRSESLSALAAVSRTLRASGTAVRLRSAGTHEALYRALVAADAPVG